MSDFKYLECTYRLISDLRTRRVNMLIKAIAKIVATLLGAATAVAEEQAVIVSFQYGLESLDELYALENKLRTALAGTGEYDGHELAADLTGGRLYIYGPDADALAKTSLPIFRKFAFMNGARLEVRYGSPKDGVKTREITVGRD